MMIEATPKNIAWLMEKLYMARRDLQAELVENPTFVLLTKGEEDRHRIEAIFLKYYLQKFGVPEMFQRVEPGAMTPRLTHLGLPEIGAHIILLDI